MTYRRFAHLASATFLAHRICNVVTGAMSLGAKFAYRDAARAPAKMASWISRYKPERLAREERPAVVAAAEKVRPSMKRLTKKNTRPRRGPRSIYGPSIAPALPSPFRACLGDLFGRELVN